MTPSVNPARNAAIRMSLALVSLTSALLAQAPYPPPYQAPYPAAPATTPRQGSTKQGVPGQAAPPGRPPAAPRPIQAQSASTFSATTAADGTQTVDIRNVSYEVTNTNVPGRPPDERLLLRRTTHSKENLGDIGVDATVTLEAWRFGDDPRNRPLYAINTTGTGGDTLDAALFIVSRGLEEVDWWSVYKLGTGQHLMDTYVPLLGFSISRDTVTQRYAGLEVPPDDTKDPRLKQPNVIAVLTYASEDHVIREALLTADDPKQAALLRSFADVTRTLTIQEVPPPGAQARPPVPPGPVGRNDTKGKPPEPAPALGLSFVQNLPSPPNPVVVMIPVVGDDLDLAHAQLPQRIHIAAWRR